MLRSRLTISSTFKELCIMNLFFKGNLLTNITTASAGLKWRKRPDKFNSVNRFLHHDYVHLRTLLCQCVKFLDKHNMAAFTHPPYSPAVMPCDFLLFPKFNTVLKRMRYHDITTNHEKSRDALAKIQRAARNASFAGGRCVKSLRGSKGANSE